MCICFHRVTVYVRMRLRAITLRSPFPALLALGSVGFLSHARFSRISYNKN